ncbi:Down syndrome cell adhesion molecule-like protein 1 isoform X2 [Gigantopelta aegis]|uniref:Down syndrome cell adhesion molecule-like protein 1 isoform X2 n=1 Tax=Gigantopelta aegis TaxID=1735272 RepID=UPI001B8875A0|nr:Down syndrome cell adhesion molecule-like protein 1 isoform X2 [Gigantopelta aegis]
MRHSVYWWILLLCLRSVVSGLDTSSVRLVNGSNDHEGRVEILHDGQWGSICDDEFNDNGAQVVCRSLGFQSFNANFYRQAHFGQSTGPIWLANVNCMGSEQNLDQCSFPGWGIHDCVHREDVGVRCQMSVRLVSGSGISSQGRVEIQINGTWGTVCDNGFNSKDAAVICAMMGFSRYGARAISEAGFGKGAGPIFFDDLACKGNELLITDCPGNPVGDHKCQHNEDAGVICQTTGVRLVNGATRYEGRVEVFHDNRWGSVCDDGFHQKEAAVICRSLSLPSHNAQVYGSGHFGRSVEPILLKNFYCEGYEQHLDQCYFSSWYNSDCHHGNDVGVSCQFGPDSVTFSPPTPGLVLEGESLNITCVAECHPPCSYFWAPGSPHFTSRPVLTLSNINMSQTGSTYTCTAKNIGSDTSRSNRFLLIVHSTPGIPSNISTRNISPTVVSVTWVEEFNGGAAQMFLVQYRGDATSQWTNFTEIVSERGMGIKHTILIPDLHPKTRYLVRVLAFNKYGYKDYTEEHEILTAVGPDLVSFSPPTPGLVLEGESLNITCLAECHPPCSYSWAPGSPHFTSRPVLTLSNINMSQTGSTYTCTAKNIGSDTSRSNKFLLIVHSTPGIPSNISTRSISPTAVSVTWVEEFNGGAAQMFLVQYRGYATSQWTNFTEIVSERGMGIKHTILIPDLHPKTRYLVRVLAFSKYGYKDYTEEHEILTAVGPDSVTFSPPTPGLVLEGESLNITCLAECHPPCSYSWSPGSPHFTSRPVLTLSNINMSQTGSTYTCTAKNIGSDASRSNKFLLIVHSTPGTPSNISTRSISPTAVSVTWVEEFNGGAAQMFLVQYRGYATSQWTNFTEIVSERGMGIKHTILIPDLHPKTRYLVRVLAFNKYGYKDYTEEHEILTAVGPDSVTFSPPTPGLVIEGESLNITCLAECHPPCSYSWAPGSPHFTSRPVLTLSNINMSQTGSTYTCTAKNIGSDTSRSNTFLLIVHSTPGIPSNISTRSISPTAVSVTWVEEFNGGAAQMFLVQYRGYATSQWTNFTEIVSERGMGIKHTILIPDLHPKTGYLVRVLAFNKYGYKDYTEEHKILTAVGPDSVTFSPPTPGLVVEGESLNITCLAECHPPCSYSWAPGSPHFTSRPVLTLSNINMSQTGSTYTCTAKNIGSDTSRSNKFLLIVHSTPSIPSNVSTHCISPTVVSITWVEEFNGGSAQMFLVQYGGNATSQWTNFTEIVSERGIDTKHTIWILDLHPKTRYLVRVLAFNKYGYKDFTEEQEILTAEASDRLNVSTATVPNKLDMLPVAIGSVSGLIILILLLVVGILVSRRSNNNDTTRRKDLTLQSR